LGDDSLAFCRRALITFRETAFIHCFVRDGKKPHVLQENGFGMAAVAQETICRLNEREQVGAVTFSCRAIGFVLWSQSNQARSFRPALFILYSGALWNTPTQLFVCWQQGSGAELIHKRKNGAERDTFCTIVIPEMHSNQSPCVFPVELYPESTIDRPP